MPTLRRTLTAQGRQVRDPFAVARAEIVGPMLELSEMVRSDDPR
jgi:hypothetical protein